MAFSDIFPTLPIGALRRIATEADDSMVRRVLSRGRASSLEDFCTLLSPAATNHLETMAALSQRLTQRHFGKVIRLFAPIYLSNECVNICQYCGFSRNNPIPRITIPVDQFRREVHLLADQGFRSLLIVAGEHPKFVSNGYVVETIQAALPAMPSVAIELGPLETEDYRPIVEAGCEAIMVYQETYHQPTYRDLHTAGPKRKFGWRMDTPERAYAAGFRRIGIGALLGLHDPLFEAIALGAHAHHLSRHCWKAQLSISFPRMRPAAGEFHVRPEHQLSDRGLVQLMTAMRLFLPHAAFSLSTRETPAFRDGVIRLGTTHMSAGSSTEPGGYSDYDPITWRPRHVQAGEQFEIADERSPREVAASIARAGYEPVWKDFDQSLIDRQAEQPYA